MNFFTKTLPVLIVRYRVGILFFVLLTTIFFTLQLKNLRINPDILSYLPKKDKEATLFNKIGENYGGNYIALIGLEAESIFSKEVLDIIADMNDSINSVEGVSYITSILNVIDIKGSEWGIEIGELINDNNFPKSKEEFKRLQAYVLSKEMYKDVLVSSQADFTMIAIKIGEGRDKIEVAVDIRNKIESMDLPLNVYFGGMPFMMSDISRIIIRDMVFLIPFASLVILLVLFLSFRTLGGVILPVLTVMISIIWTMGMMAIMDIELSIVSNIIPVILLAVGTAYTIHVINKVNQTEGKNIQDKIEKALSYIIIPVVITALTTMIGFISFIFGSYLTMIAIFGLFSALGVFFSLILSISFAPALIMVFSFPDRGIKKSRSNLKPGVFEKILTGTNRLVVKYPKQILAFWALLLLLSFLGIFRIERRVDVMDYFKKGSSTRMAEEKLRLKLGGTMPVYALIQGDVQSPEVLRSMRNIADTMAGFSDISHTQSIADLIEEMNDVMGEGSRIPDEKAKIQQLWFLLEGQDILDQMVNYEMDEALIQATFSTMDSRSQKEFMQKMRQYAIEHSTSESELQFTGFPAIYEKLDESIAESQFKSLVLAIVLVFLIISILFKSVRNGFFASIPIVATLIILFGFMGWSKIPLDIATVLVGSISIGIGIDYAIHMISYFNHEYSKTKNYRISIKNAISVSGKAILINALSVSFGFLVLVFGNLIPLQRFGILVAVTMVASGLGALTLLPSVLVLKKE